MGIFPCPYPECSLLFKSCIICHCVDIWWFILKALIERLVDCFQSFTITNGLQLITLEVYHFAPVQCVCGINSQTWYYWVKHICICNFDRYHQMALHRGCTNTNSQQQCAKELVFSQSCQQGMFLIFWIFANLISKKWDHSVISISISLTMYESCIFS